MQGLYLIILRSIKETNLDEKKTELKGNQSQQTIDKLAYRNLVTYSRIDLKFLLLAATMHSRPIYRWARGFKCCLTFKRL